MKNLVLFPMRMLIGKRLRFSCMMTVLWIAGCLVLFVPGHEAEASLLVGYRFDSGAGALKFVHVDPTTGAATDVGPGVPGVTAITGNASGFASGGFYSVRARVGSSPDKLYSFDVNTGAVISSPDFSTSPFSLRYGSSGKILGMRFNSSTGEFLSIDPATGVISTVGSGIPNLQFLTGEAGYDFVNGEYSLLGPLNDAQGNRLFNLDETTGSLQQTSPVPASTSSVGFWAYDGSGRILGLRFDSGTERLVAIDPSTGSTTNIGAIPNFGFITGGGTYDPMTDVFTFAGNRTSEGSRLFSINATTGAIVSEPFYSANIQGLTYALPEPSALLLSVVGLSVFVCRILCGR